MTKNQPTPHSLKSIYLQDIQEDLTEFSQEIGLFRRLKESSPDQEVKDAITGIIQDEIHIIHHYRKELL
jgi:hypothetical protein